MNRSGIHGAWIPSWIGSLTGNAILSFKREMRVCPRWYAIPVNFLSLIAVLYVLAAALKFSGVLPDLNEQRFVFAVIRCPKAGVTCLMCIPGRFQRFLLPCNKSNMFGIHRMDRHPPTVQHWHYCLWDSHCRPPNWKVRLSHCFAIPHFFCSVFCAKRPTPSCRWGSDVDLQALKGKMYFFSMIHNLLQWTVFLMANLSGLPFLFGGQERLDSLWLCQAASLWRLSFLEFMPPFHSCPCPLSFHRAFAVHADKPCVCALFRKWNAMHARFYSI